jgi:hypothetical protein
MHVLRLAVRCFRKVSYLSMRSGLPIYQKDVHLVVDKCCDTPHIQNSITIIEH